VKSAVLGLFEVFNFFDKLGAQNRVVGEVAEKVKDYYELSCIKNRHLKKVWRVRAQFKFYPCIICRKIVCE
jgi:hypothetical protein